ncbi:MAG: phosphatase PAP2 family protein [Candidatus Omnitrophica bacterium]|nr:phosphatase PAP2 family protein [Candidatus Omnitrophota bacterium]
MALTEFDTALFTLLNSKWHAAWLDWAMPKITNFFIDVYPFVVLCIIVMIAGRARGLVTGALMVLALAFSNVVTGSWLKPLFGRPRPFAALEDVRLLIPPPASMSFPSTHATISFAVAVVVAFRHPRAAVWIFGWAVLMAYTRAYVGVHYPSDLLGGAIAGTLIGWGLVLTEKGIRRAAVRTVKDR